MLGIFLVYYLVVIVFLDASIVSAQGPIITASPFSGTISDVINRVIDFLVTVSIPITVLMVLIGAFQMLTSGGNAEQFRKGTKTVIYSIVGFALVLLARGSTTLIRELITGS